MTNLFSLVGIEFANDARRIQMLSDKKIVWFYFVGSMQGAGFLPAKRTSK